MPVAIDSLTIENSSSGRNYAYDDDSSDNDSDRDDNELYYDDWKKIDLAYNGDREFDRAAGVAGVVFLGKLIYCVFPISRQESSETG